MAKRNRDQQKQDSPILIYTDEAAVRNAQHKLEDIIIPELEKVKQAFDKLQIGPFTNAWLKDLLSSGTQSIQRELMAQIEKETPSRFLKDEAQKAARRQLSLVAGALEELNAIADRYYDLLEYPSVDEAGNIKLTEEAIQVLREANSIYATSPKAKELYKVHKATAAALDRFYQMVKAEITSNPVDLARFFTIDEEEGKVKPEVIDYEYSEYVTGRVRNFV